MKIMGCFRKQIVIGAFITFCKFFSKCLASIYFRTLMNSKITGYAVSSQADILLSQGHATKGRCVPGYLKLPLSGKSVHVSAPQWCRMARPIFKKGLVALSV